MGKKNFRNLWKLTAYNYICGAKPNSVNQYLFRFVAINCLLLTGLILKAQNYTPLDLSEGATWSHTECGFKPDWGAVYKFKIYGDTVVRTHLYQKLYYQSRRSEGVCANCNFSFNRDSATLFALIRQDIVKKKVYFIYPSLGDKEWLGYNFDINAVGQSVTGFSLIFTTRPEAPVAAIYIYQLDVEEIDTFCLNGEWVRRYYFGPGSGGNPYHYAEYWIEGLGSTHGLLVQGFGGPDWLQKLYCFHNATSGVYYDSTAVLSCIEPNSLTCAEGMDCSPPTAIDLQYTRDPVAVYPNPLSNTMVVENQLHGQNIELWFSDMMGRVVWKKTLYAPGELTSVSVHDLPSGFYYLTIRAGELYGGRKMIKQ